MAIGSYADGALPSLLGAGEFSFASIIFAEIGGLLGIWIGFKFGE